MARHMALGYLLLVLAVLAWSADAQCTNPVPYAVANGQPGADCPTTGSALTGTTCSVVCDEGFTSYPEPQLICEGTNWNLVSDANLGPITCNPVCPGDPPPAPGVEWVQVSDQNLDPVSPAALCTNQTGTFTACLGRCTTADPADPPSVIAFCNDVNGAPTWDNPIGADACVSATCDGLPPTPNNGTLWPLVCSGLGIGKNCTASCRNETINYWGTGNNTDQFPTIQCVANASSPTGGSWDSSTLLNPCVPVCNRPERIWIRNGSWPEWCEPDLSTQIGGLTKNQLCSGVCLPGHFGTPQWVCSPMGRFKSNRTGDCFPVIPGVRGGCFGPVTAAVPTNAQPWDLKKCWDMRTGWNCSTECNGDWDANVTDPTAIGYGTAEANTLPHVKCLYDDTSLPYYGRYSEPRGLCVPVCRGPLPDLMNGFWPDNCLPASGGIGGTRNNGSLCLGTCAPGFYGNPYVACTSQGWSALFGGCANQTSPPDTCQGAVATFPATAGNADPWPASCANQAVGYRCNTTCSGLRENGGAFGTAQLTYTPFTVCNDSVPFPTWRPSITGTCYRVCDGAPPAVANTVWDPRCTRQPDGIGGVRPNSDCVGTCANGFVGAPTIKCTPLSSGTAWTWAPVSQLGGTPCTAVGGPPPLGICAGKPTGWPTNTQSPGWPNTCSNQFHGFACKAVCNSGYASGSLSTPIPTSTCQAASSTWSAVTGRCVQVCRVAPPPATGVVWNCMPVTTGLNIGTGGTRTGGGICYGTCAAGFTQIGSTPPYVQCGSATTWGAPFNPCSSSRHRHLLTGKQL